MKKTVLKKLIEELEYRTKEDKHIDTDQLIYNLNILLEEEKKMIIESYNSGLINGYNYTATGKEYYRTTYESEDSKVKENTYEHLETFRRGRSKY